MLISVNSGIDRVKMGGPSLGGAMEYPDRDKLLFAVVFRVIR